MENSEATGVADPMKELWGSGEAAFAFRCFTKINKCTMKRDQPQLVHPERRQHPECFVGVWNIPGHSGLLGQFAFRVMCSRTCRCRAGAPFHFCCTAFRRGDKQGVWWLVLELGSQYFPGHWKISQISLQICQKQLNAEIYT